MAGRARAASKEQQVTRAKSRAGRPPKYPWDAWFAQPSFRLEKGRDYVLDTSSMVNAVRGEASLRKVSISVVQDYGYIEVTVRKREVPVA